MEPSSDFAPALPDVVEVEVYCDAVIGFSDLTYRTRWGKDEHPVPVGFVQLNPKLFVSGHKSTGNRREHATADALFASLRDR